MYSTFSSWMETKIKKPITSPVFFFCKRFTVRFMNFSAITGYVPSTRYYYDNSAGKSQLFEMLGKISKIENQLFWYLNNLKNLSSFFFFSPLSPQYSTQARYVFRAFWSLRMFIFFIFFQLFIFNRHDNNEKLVLLITTNDVVFFSHSPRVNRSNHTLRW